MLRRTLALAVIGFCLNGCSYVYEVLAVVSDGRVTFTANVDCVRQIEVRSESNDLAQADGGDDPNRLDFGTFWFESIANKDHCENRFPITYGVGLAGEQQEERGFVEAKTLLREVVYMVNTTTGSTGYGSGRFIIRADGSVENLS